MRCFSIGRTGLPVLVCVASAILGIEVVPAVAQQEAPAVKPLELKAQGEQVDPTAPIEVPDGKPEELIEFIENISSEKPPAGIAQDVMKGFITARLRALATAGSKVLAAKPTEEQALAATRARLSALVGLKNLKEEGADKQMAGLPAELVAAGYAKMARAVESVLLQRRLAEAQAAGPEQLEAVVDEIVKFLSAGPVERSDVGLAMRTTMLLEQSGKLALAAKAYAEFGKVLTQSDDKQVVGFGKKMEGAARRLQLLGNPMEVAGTDLDGKKLDWDKFKNKSVLVMFWATWCGPCKAELPNVLQLYEQYHDKGFEVVGISCDDDRDRLDSFVKDQELPWPILFSNDPDATGMENPMANHYGVMGIPMMILVGPDGKVVSLSARGPALARELEKIYGPAEKPAAEVESE